MRPIEKEAEQKGNFRYDLFKLFEAADAIEDPELREATLSMCDDLRSKSVEYLGYVARFIEGTQDEQIDFARRLSHNAIISDLSIITRSIGGDFAKWFTDPAMEGGLGGETDRRRIKSWALHEGLHILAVQHAREEAEDEATRTQGSINNAA